MIYIQKPKNYEVKPGQYAFINVPSVSRFQWHPFSIASSPLNKYIIFMIKRNGDWTGKFIDKLVKAKKEKLRIQDIDINKNEEQIFEIMLDMDDQITHSKKKYFPVIHISRPVTSAAETAVY